MNTNKNHIFSTSNETLPLAEIKRYVLGEMSEKEKHRVELLMESDAFLADAIEGYQRFPDAVGITTNHTHTSRWGKGKYVWGIFSGLLLIGISAWYFTRSETISKAPISKQQRATSKNNEITTTTAHPIEILESHYSDTSIQVTSKRRKSKKKFKEKEEKFAQVEKEIIKKEAPLVTIPTNKIIDSIENNQQEKKVEVRKNFEIYHIVDYTVYDYRGKREEPIKLLAPITNGTPASQANKNTKAEELNPVTKVYYDDYLKEAIIMFSKQNYQQASKKFKTILKKYPDDVNALFYLSMCSFKREKHKKAQLEFQKYLNQPITLFDEDASFFLAVSYFKTKNWDQAKKLFNEIITQRGFYKNQSNEYLKQIKP